MFSIFRIFFLIITISLSNCSNVEKEKKIPISEKNLQSQMIDFYEKGIVALEEGDYLFAAKNFGAAETIFPLSNWAPKAILMSSYSFYSGNYYGDAISELKKFILLYKNHKDLPYAYYMLGICYYELIVDEVKDLEPIENSKKYFNILIDNYPNTDFALDAEFKIRLIRNVLASKEIYIGNYYLEKKKWVAAINRFKFIIDNYQDTQYLPEALHRLVEINYILGLESEAMQYASVLGYNYLSSEWYNETYKIFNTDYEDPIKQIKNDKKQNLIKKFVNFLK